ncbi:predicted protein [Histoplasma capsulatum G186AR]|uniref:Uncharacterized protein n=1 Tax=Ajellomyces capsulatus (strain G186AR / H82 / ATCC MYA-2454 / RMSCC 2432) TaxID=447093 RepID=C0NRB1_AJECG|nr:uncharacterized protein HCBG_05541 [Histoplasma capsulatum G186AR]EEH06225.1 predicted protein [Histoplasma capsulatum G186AR]
MYATRNSLAVLAPAQAKLVTGTLESGTLKLLGSTNCAGWTDSWVPSSLIGWLNSGLLVSFDHMCENDLHGCGSVAMLFAQFISLPLLNLLHFTLVEEFRSAENGVRRKAIWSPDGKTKCRVGRNDEEMAR